MQQEGETPPLPSLQAPAAIAFLNGFINKHSLYANIHTGSLGQWRRDPTGTGAEPAFNPSSSGRNQSAPRDNLQPLKHTCNQLHTHTLTQVKRDQRIKSVSRQIPRPETNQVL